MGEKNNLETLDLLTCDNWRRHYPEVVCCPTCHSQEEGMDLEPDLVVHVADRDGRPRLASLVCCRMREAIIKNPHPETRVLSEAFGPERKGPLYV